MRCELLRHLQRLNTMNSWTSHFNRLPSLSSRNKSNSSSSNMPAQKKNNMVVTVCDTVARQNRAHAQHATCQKSISSTKLSAILKLINRRCGWTANHANLPVFTDTIDEAVVFFKRLIKFSKTKQNKNTDRVCAPGNGKSCKWIPELNLSILMCVSIENCLFISKKKLFFIRHTTQTVTTHS